MKIPKNAQHLWGLLLIILAVCLLGMIFKRSEAFSNLTPGVFPESVDEPLLNNDFPVNSLPSLSNSNYSSNCSSQNIHPSNSFETNNERYRSSPDNGRCSPIDMCGVYSEKKVDPPNHKIPYPWDPDKTRVNLYYGHKFLYC